MLGGWCYDSEETKVYSVVLHGNRFTVSSLIVASSSSPLCGCDEWKTSEGCAQKSPKSSLDVPAAVKDTCVVTNSSPGARQSG